VGSGNSYDGIDPYAARLIKHKARQLVGKAGHTWDDVEDIEQDLTLDVLRRLSKYKPDRSQLNTFVALVVEHRIASLIAARKARMRDYRLCCCSLNDYLENEDGDTVERIETVDQEDYFRRTGRLSRTATELGDLALDIREVAGRLPPKLRELCRLLQTDTITKISRDTGVPRTTLYEGIKKLRAFFEDAGLREYL
jgi:RNA polymerase sigma-70 factor (ECF subfamily)